MSDSTSNERLKAWVDEWAAVLQPNDIHWCDGSAREYEQLCQALVDCGTFTQLDEAKRRNPDAKVGDVTDLGGVVAISVSSVRSSCRKNRISSWEST